MTVTPEDETAVSAQLGRTARGIRSIAHRCTCGLPDVVETEPRLPDGTPFPTTYYVTCPRLASAIGRLEAEGVMKEMTDRLATDEDLAAQYRGQTQHQTQGPRRPQSGSISSASSPSGFTPGPAASE